MSCTFSREALALHAEGDLLGRDADITARHLEACEECRQVLKDLRASQSLLKSMRRETATRADCAAMRRDVMALISERRDGSGWFLRVERAVMVGFQRRSYAMAASILLGILSVSVVAQLRPATSGADRSPAILEGTDTLLRPEGYRDWILVGPAAGGQSSHRSDAAGVAHTASTAVERVYIKPSSYREYSKTGKFPEGTLMIWEAASGDPEPAGGLPRSSPVLLASLKDSTRFEGGWGFFDFTDPGGAVASRAQPLPESRGCRTCHRHGAKTVILAYRG